MARVFHFLKYCCSSVSSSLIIQQDKIPHITREKIWEDFQRSFSTSRKSNSSHRKNLKLIRKQYFNALNLFFRMGKENFKAKGVHNSPHHFHLWTLKVQVTKDDGGKTVIISLLFLRTNQSVPRGTQWHWDDAMQWKYIIKRWWIHVINWRSTHLRSCKSTDRGIRVLRFQSSLLPNFILCYFQCHKDNE